MHIKLIIFGLLIVLSSANAEAKEQSDITKDQKILVGASKTGESSDSCAQQCGDNYLCKTFCLQKGPMIAAIVGSIFTFIFAIILFCICYDRNMCLFWPFHPYQQLKKTFNVIQSGEMNKERFDQTVQKVLQNFKTSQKSNNFTKVDNDGQQIIKCNKVWSKKIKPFLYKLYLKGSDSLSKFKAHGYITCKKGQIFCWFIIIYKSKYNSGQAGDITII